MTEAGLSLVAEASEPHPLDRVRAELERARREVSDKLSSLRGQRAQINDEIRDLVAQESLLTRMARVNAPKKTQSDD